MSDWQPAIVIKAHAWENPDFLYYVGKKVRVRPAKYFDEARFTGGCDASEDEYYILHPADMRADHGEVWCCKHEILTD